MKMTPQRVAILDFLEGNKSHPSAEDIYKSVKKRYTSMSFATVYNTLELLTKEGMLLELTIDTNRKRYDPNTSEHHHIICTSCGTVSDIHQKFNLSVDDEVSGGFSIKSNHVEFYGLCPSCDLKGGS
jgi:Fur family peroxide stress response transcriptional regulator